ncbi:MAG: amidohydrolase family protein [Armatimonadetes bacterium]|nr:amidohydrolase family protein [Armatimonadota bacterium]
MTSIIRARRLIDGTGAPALKDAAVVVEGSRLVTVGPAREAANTRGETIDLGDCTLLPGLFDAHTHLSFNYGDDLIGSSRGMPPEVRALRAARNIRRDLKAGITTLRVTGEREFLDVTIKKAVEQGLIPGPRLVIATRGLAATNGHGGETPGNAVDGPDEMRKAVRTNLRRGADLIKLLVTGSVDSPGGHFNCGFTREEIAAGVEEAHRGGKKVGAHSVRPEDIKLCIQEGVDAIEHGHILDDECIAMMVERGTWLVATLAIAIDEHVLAKDMELNPTFADVEWLPRRRAARESYRKAHQAGIRMACGTDAMHAQMAYELESLVGAGIPPMDAILAATRNAAQLCDIDHLVGTLEAGKLADVIAVRGDPLATISAMRDVCFVMKEGRRYDTLSPE